MSNTILILIGGSKIKKSGLSEKNAFLKVKKNDCHFYGYATKQNVNKLGRNMIFNIKTKKTKRQQTK